jgi:hypothetical protein
LWVECWHVIAACEQARHEACTASGGEALRKANAEAVAAGGVWGDTCVWVTDVWPQHVSKQCRMRVALFIVVLAHAVKLSIDNKSRDETPQRKLSRATG